LTTRDFSAGQTPRLWAVLAFIIAGLACAAPVETVEAEEPGNTLRWSTASEVDSYGFDVYRSTEEDGTFTVINDKPIAGAGDSDTPTDYEFVDRDIEPDTKYYYYIESISMSGIRERATPVIHAIPRSATR